MEHRALDVSSVSTGSIPGWPIPCPGVNAARARRTDLETYATVPLTRCSHRSLSQTVASIERGRGHSSCAQRRPPAPVNVEGRRAVEPNHAGRLGPRRHPGAVAVASRAASGRLFCQEPGAVEARVPQSAHSERAAKDRAPIQRALRDLDIQSVAVYSEVEPAFACTFLRR